MKATNKLQIKKVGLSECENFRRYCIVIADRHKTRVLTNNLERALERLAKEGKEIVEIFEQELNEETLNRPTSYAIICDSINEAEGLHSKLFDSPNQTEKTDKFFGINLRHDGLAFYFSAQTYFSLKDYITLKK
jgi:hypothetical protein